MSRSGNFVWYDLMTTEPDGAVDFYGKVVGWGTTQWDGPNPYTMWTAGEQPIGGVMQMPDEARSAGAPPHWIAYVECDDVAAACDRIESLGGQIVHPPQEIPDTGFFAVVADPQGAVFAIYSHARDEDQGAPSLEPGRFSWHELATTDPDAAWEFYSAAFGWEKTDSMDMGEGGIYQMYGAGGDPLGGIFRKPDEMPVSAWLYYAMVDDVDEAAKTVTELGGQVVNGPMEVPGGDRIVQCMDPQGGMFALHSKASASA